MDSSYDKKRMSVEGDRLSNLPDDLIHKILSYIGIKQVIEMTVLSSRWRYVWTSVPCLDFSSQDFSAVIKFSKFVTRVLTHHRNKKVQVYSIKLSFRGKTSHGFVKRIIKYAVSHDVPQLSIKSLDCKRNSELLLPLFSSRSLKHLTLTGSYSYCNGITLTSIWELPALTTLYLKGLRWFDQRADLFSNCPNLKNLTLIGCKSTPPNRLNHSVFNIFHTRLTDLTLESIEGYVNVEAPQLKNLIVKGICSLKFSADVALSLEKLDLCISKPHKSYADKIVGLLQQVQGLKFLTLNLEIVELLSSYEPISHQPSPFANLKSLKIYPVSKRIAQKKKVNVSNVVKNYFLDSSLSATVNLVKREEIRAQATLERLQRLLNQLKESIENNKAQMLMVENQRAQQETKMQWRERLTHIGSYWKDLNEWHEKVNKKACRIIKMSRKIEILLRKMPTSNRVKMQSIFARLGAEADAIMDNMIDHMRIKYSKKPCRLDVSLIS
ncbi:F-box domain, Leucine-rich repeat domain, L domain-like protein [Artemisia annua]|uniref:F-box domain, Leucine-rich repeat domain, L domain-like protein n=1 Tax=Artemisia annua TaxID=35608 RepID=A0A2U1PUA0_ARTAN|nr:F-box domain, Leucine-rich repeat domain, L domain-like protein [Artemisia annua]